MERGIVAPSFPTIERLTEQLDVPAAAFFGLGTLTVPAGKRGRLLQRINRQLSKLNDDTLAQVSKMLEAF